MKSFKKIVDRPPKNIWKIQNCNRSKTDFFRPHVSFAKHKQAKPLCTCEGEILDA